LKVALNERERRVFADLQRSCVEGVTLELAILANGSYNLVGRRGQEIVLTVGGSTLGRLKQRFWASHAKLVGMLQESRTA
jgi:hypothetical protein